MVAIMVLLTIGVFIAVDALVRRRQTANQQVRAFAPAYVREALQKVWMGSPALQTADFRPRPDRFYNEGHTFVELLADGKVEIGIDRFLREAMADFRVVALLREGQSVRRGEAIAELRSNGRRARVLSPIDGVVTRTIPPMPDEGVEPALYSIQPENLSPNLQSMSVGAQASAWLEREIGKLQKFADAMMPRPAMVGATSADGGTPVDPLTMSCDEHQFGEFKSAFGLE